MSDTHSHRLHAESPEYASPLGRGEASTVYVGGALGIGGSFVGLAIFAAACFGFEAALSFSVLPLALGAAGMILSIVGAIVTRAKVEDMHVVASLFVNLFAIVGGLLEVAVWSGWNIFGKIG